MPNRRAERRRGLLLVFAATVLWSLAGLFARLLSHLDYGAILCGRAAFGGLSALVLSYVDWRRGGFEARRLVTPLAPLVVMLSTVAISGYVAALLTTTVADVLAIYATLPFFAAGLAYAITGERASRRTLIAAGAAFVGVAIMVAGGLGEGRLLGQALSLAMTATFALLVVLQRRDPNLPIVPINAVAALLSAAFGYSVSKHAPVSASDVALLSLFGVTTITIGFALFMEGAKRVPAAEGALIAMLDVVLGPLWVLIAIGERPDGATMIGGGVVLAAALWRLAPELRRARDIVASTPPPL